MVESIDKGFSLLNKLPETQIIYTLPDGSTTVWLNEYVDGIVQAEQERIIKLLEVKLLEQNIGMFYADAIRASIKLIKEEE